MQSDEAAANIDKFVEKQTKEDSIRAEKAKFTGGCKTIEDRTVINTREAEEEMRRLKSEEIKEMGNKSFRSGHYNQAEEYYTSALMQYDKVLNIIFGWDNQTEFQNHILFTNRAQTRLKQLKYQDAVDDCKEAIKLKQDNLKTIIIITKALRGMRDYQKALDMLDIAEKIPDVNINIVNDNRREIIAEMKQFMKQ